MAIENVKQFYQLVATDEELKRKLVEVVKPYEGQQMEESKKNELVESHILPLAKEKGLPFTLEELKQYELEQYNSQADAELNMDELATVAGGFAIAFCLIIGLVGGVVWCSFCVFAGSDF